MNFASKAQPLIEKIEQARADLLRTIERNNDFRSPLKHNMSDLQETASRSHKKECGMTTPANRRPAAQTEPKNCHDCKYIFSSGSSNESKLQSPKMSLKEYLNLKNNREEVVLSLQVYREGSLKMPLQFQQLLIASVRVCDCRTTMMMWTLLTGRFRRPKSSARERWRKASRRWRAKRNGPRNRKDLTSLSTWQILYPTLRNSLR